MIIKNQQPGPRLQHYGILRKSGRYPWGSGGNVTERSRSFLDYIKKMLGMGLSEAEVARGVGMTTTELRAAKTIARNEAKAADIAMAQRLKDKGMSNVAIGERMGLAESSVRALLAPGARDRADVLVTTSQMLKEQVDTKGYIDVGSGVENHVGVTRTRLDTAIAMLKEDGYQVHNVQVDQLGTANKTLIKVLAPPGTTYRDIVTNMGDIHQIQEYSDDGGRSFLGLNPPQSVDLGRVGITYADQGGTEADGVIYVRPGIDDISLEGSTYAQVRIAVNGTHYLKGMAMYKDDLPAGVDLMFNTNKNDTGNKLDALKKLTDDPDNPFGAVVDRQNASNVMNILREEGSWDSWSRNLSSQMLSKQSPTLAKSQLNMTYESRKADLDEIMSLTNPAVRKKLLEEFADSADSSAVHLEAAALPRQSSHVILPISSLKDTEVYAPNFKNGERVALIRYPHGGTFEIPELTVNNNHPDAKKIMGQATDAIGINHKVAERLSGADFDGDTVVVIPNDSGKIKSSPALEGLKGFDPQSAYPAYEGMKRMDARTKGLEMGQVSNLITDMTIQGANTSELARAVRHSMVVIDAEKHKLNYKQSAIDNGIPNLKEKYQGRSNAGASTLISRASAQINVNERKPRSAAKGGPIDPATGKKIYEETGAGYTNAKGKWIPRTTKSKKLAETDDANTLSSGTAMEKIYADHSNKLKSLANTARRESVHTPNVTRSPSAAKAYSKEVDSLNAKLDLAYRNRPLERQAQVLANTVVSAKRQARPDMDESEIKKIKSQALDEARTRTGAKKRDINITDSEWDAIQAGALSNQRLNDILRYADKQRVKELATPRANKVMTSTKLTRAKAMLASGYTQADVAAALGVSLSTLKRGING